jgi:Rrf2 family transcriptional regulator, cysteine metabolism repressor
MSLSLSTRSRYGVRFMVGLAQGWGRGSILLKDISRREGISEKYLSQIVIPLKASGLLTAQRGARGGYALARPPAEVTVLQIVEAIEGPLVPVPCTAEASADCEQPCERMGECAASTVWMKLKIDIEASLSSRTLADLAREARRRVPATTYTI